MHNLICYCFEYTEEDIRQDFITHGRSRIMDEIKAAKKMPAGCPPGGGQIDGADTGPDGWQSIRKNCSPGRLIESAEIAI